MKRLAVFGILLAVGCGTRDDANVAATPVTKATPIDTAKPFITITHISDICPARELTNMSWGIEDRTNLLNSCYREFNEVKYCECSITCLINNYLYDFYLENTQLVINDFVRRFDRGCKNYSKDTN